MSKRTVPCLAVPCGAQLNCTALWRWGRCEHFFSLRPECPALPLGTGRFVPGEELSTTIPRTAPFSRAAACSASAPRPFVTAPSAATFAIPVPAAVTVLIPVAVMSTAASATPRKRATEQSQNTQRWYVPPHQWFWAQSQSVMSAPTQSHRQYVLENSTRLKDFRVKHFTWMGGQEGENDL